MSSVCRKTKRFSWDIHANASLALFIAGDFGFLTLIQSRDGDVGPSSGRRFRMRNHIDMDEALRRAIIREIGEKLRASFREDPELPETFARQIDRLRQLETNCRSQLQIGGWPRMRGFN